MQHADMDENRRHKTPPLPARNLRIRLHAESQQRGFIHAAAAKSHQHENQNVQGEKEIRERSFASPDRVQKFEVVVCNHVKREETTRSTKGTNFCATCAFCGSFLIPSDPAVTSRRSRLQPG